MNFKHPISALIVLVSTLVIFGNAAPIGVSPNPLSRRCFIGKCEWENACVDIWALPDHQELLHANFCHAQYSCINWDQFTTEFRGGNPQPISIGSIAFSGTCCEFHSDPDCGGMDQRFTMCNQGNTGIRWPGGVGSFSCWLPRKRDLGYTIDAPAEKVVNIDQHLNATPTHSKHTIFATLEPQIFTSQEFARATSLSTITSVTTESFGTRTSIITSVNTETFGTRTATITEVRATVFL